MAVSLSALRACCPLPPGKFLVLISVRGRVDPRAIVRLKYWVNWKIQWLIGNRARDLPACNTVPQPTTLPRALSSPNDAGKIENNFPISHRCGTYPLLADHRWRCTGHFQLSTEDSSSQLHVWRVLSSEMWHRVDTYNTTRRHIPENSNHHHH
jgi:hypothetical protein